MSKGKLSLSTVICIGIIVWALAGGVLGANVPGYAKVFCPRADTRSNWSADDQKMAQESRCESISRP
ncbi:hypothetical protein ACGFY9_19825 [Streptomyces sp. NPDC048504]|uniref:hypothetical protein n=1 Tax=Streptomyces sp. NPDC048504 TaxID=3365559 RepID=UPI00371A0B7D